MTHHPLALLTPEEMTAADAATIASGTAGFVLMQRAGKAVAEAVLRGFEKRPVLVACGPGNNGGDGFVIASYLRDAGWDVELATLSGDLEAYQGDAALAVKMWDGDVIELTFTQPSENTLIIDALFGTGLARPIDGELAAWIEQVNHTECDVVAVDIPSGIDGKTGHILGNALKASLTVTFHRKKRGHVLQPGRGYAGEVLIANIGITEDSAAQAVFENDPANWLMQMHWPDADSHKYQRGAVLVQGGELEKAGAAKLSATAALRAGAGLSTIAVDAETLPAYAAMVTSVMTQEITDVAALTEALANSRITAFLIGPGAGLSPATRERVLAATTSNKPLLLDADALSVFADAPQELFAALESKQAILTPHSGEFARLFPSIDIKADKVAAARHASEISHAVVVLKGSDTVIASPDGRVAIQGVASPFLATAGSGDVLAGITTGLLATGMPAFEAACAGVWLHGYASTQIGAGMIADDLIDQLPDILRFLHMKSGSKQ